MNSIRLNYELAECIEKYELAKRNFIVEIKIND